VFFVRTGFSTYLSNIYFTFTYCSSLLNYNFLFFTAIRFRFVKDIKIGAYVSTQLIEITMVTQRANSPKKQSVGVYF